MEWNCKPSTILVVLQGLVRNNSLLYQGTSVSHSSLGKSKENSLSRIGSEFSGKALVYHM